MFFVSGLDDFKNWLRVQMSKKNWTQQTLADMLKVSRPTISTWQNGLHAPDPLSIRRLAEATEVQPSFLFQMLGYLPAEEQGVTPSTRDAKVERLVDILMSLPKEERDRLLSAYEQIAVVVENKGKGK